MSFSEEPQHNPQRREHRNAASGDFLSALGRSALNGNAAELFLLDKKLRLVWCNDRLAQRLEPAAERLGNPCYQLLCHRRHFCPSCPTRQVLKNGRVAFRRSPATAEGCQISLALPFRQNKRQAAQVLAIAFPAAAAPASGPDSENYFRTLFHHSGTAVAVIGEDGTLLDVNQRFLELSGYSRQEIIGRMTSADFNKDKEQDRQYHRLRRIDPDSAPKQYELTLLRKDGGERLMQIGIDVIPGTRLSLISLIDITEKRALEKAARQGERHLANLLKNSMVGIGSLDAEGRITSWNRGAQNIFGYTPEEVLGQSVEMLFEKGSSSLERLRELTQQVRQNGYLGNTLLQHRHKSGCPILLNLTFTAIIGEDNQYQGLSGVFHDVTHQKALEKRLIQQEKMSLLGQLSAALTHEIKNPLHSMFINVEVLRTRIQQVEPAVQGRLKKYVDVVEAELHRLHQVIEGFLDFARPGGGQLRSLNLNDILPKVIALVSIQAKRCGARLDFVPHRNLPTILGEENQLQQIFLNLILNSLEALNSNGQIRISTGLNAGSRVFCRISDNGHGIPQEDQSKVFDLFFSTKRKGSGIGLALVKKLVEYHGGQIALQSAPGQGTTFTLIFPNLKESELWKTRDAF